MSSISTAIWQGMVMVLQISIAISIHRLFRPRKGEGEGNATLSGYAHERIG